MAIVHRKDKPPVIGALEEMYIDMRMNSAKKPAEIVAELWPDIKGPIQKAANLERKPEIRNEILRRQNIERYRVPYTERDIIEKMMREADNFLEINNAHNRIKAIVWLGRHIGMFREEPREENTSITYNVVDWSNAYPEFFNAFGKAAAREGPKLIEHANDLTDIDG